MSPDMRPPVRALPMCYSIPNDSASGGEDGSRARRQQDHLELLLAEQLVVDEFARGSNPHWDKSRLVTTHVTTMLI